MNNKARAGIAVAAAAALVIAFVIANDSSDSDKSETTTTVVKTVTTESTVKTTTVAAADTVVVKDEKPVGGVKTLSFAKGDQIKFKVQSDSAQEIHVHGYDIAKDVAADGSVSFSFEATIEGLFEVELEGPGVEILTLEVTP